MQSSPSLSLHILGPSPAQNQCGNIDEIIVHLRTCILMLHVSVTLSVLVISLVQFLGMPHSKILDYCHVAQEEVGTIFPQS